MDGDKISYEHLTQRHLGRSVTRNSAVIILAFVAAAQIVWHQAFYMARFEETSTALGPSVAEGFSWSNIVPSHNLDYHPCYDGLECARLLVPLDYNDPSEPAQIAIAVIRRPARVPLTSRNYGGAVIINPGGPGGSGVAQQLSMGPYIQKVVDAGNKPALAEPSDKYFDLLSFDPRGVNHTTPTISCFPDNVSRKRWDLQSTAEGLLGSSAVSLRSKWRRARAIAEGCSARLGKLGEHVNTTPVARDIVSIIEQHGIWRQAQALDLSSQSNPETIDVGVRERLSWKKGREPLLYWGFSYGTLLGSTFASMYPSRVQRMVLDGVVDASDYYSGSWMKNLEDTDQILANFHRYCSEAGPSVCPFWRPGGPAAIREAYEHLLTAIRSDPLSVPGTGQRGPELITWTDIKLLVAYSLYSPLQYFPLLATLLNDLTHGNGSLFADYKTGNQRQLCTSPRTPAEEEACHVPFSHACVLPGWSPYDVSSAVLCTDAPPEQVQFNESTFAAYWATLQRQSATMGDFWAQTRLSCAGWSARAKWRRSPTPIGRGGDKPDTATAHGILFVGNTADPVTPLVNARRMARRFMGAALLRQDSEGHCSFTEPSSCTAKVVRAYFQTGEMPEVGVVCLPDRRPFSLPVAEVERDGSQGAVGDREMEVMLQNAGEVFDPFAGMELRVL